MSNDSKNEWYDEEKSYNKHKKMEKINNHNNLCGYEDDGFVVSDY